MKTLATGAAIAAIYCLAQGQRPTAPGNGVGEIRPSAPTVESNLTTLSNVVEIVSTLRAGMNGADLGQWLGHHGFTNPGPIYSLSVDRGRTSKSWFPLAVHGRSLVLETECTERPDIGLFGWKNPLLKRAYVQGPGTNVVVLSLRDGTGSPTRP